MSEWPQVTIGECCDILDSMRIPVNGEERSKRVGSVPYYGANGLQGFIDDHIFDERLILMAEDGGYFDEFATRPVAYQIFGKSWVNNHAHVLRASTGYDQSFVFFCLEHKDVMPFIRGGTRAKLNQLELRQVAIPSPPIPEQRKIARILTTVDNLIEQTEALIEKYKSIKQGMMHDLFTRGVDQSGQLRPSCEEAPHLYKQSALGWIPKDWGVDRLDSVVEFWDGRRIPIKQEDRDMMQGDIPYYGASGIIDYVNDYIFDDDLILLGEDGENVVSRNVPLAFKISGKSWVNNHAHVLKPRANANIDYLTEHLEFQDYSSLTSGSAQPKITQSILAPMLVCVPPIAEQLQLAKRILSLSIRLTGEQSSMGKYRILKTGLMQDLLTGKVRVNVDEAEQSNYPTQSACDGIGP